MPHIASVEVVWVRIVMRSYVCNVLEYFCILVSEKIIQLHIVFSIVCSIYYIEEQCK